MKITSALLLVLMLAAGSPAADNPGSIFPNVGETYRIATAAPLAEIPFNNIVTITALGDHQWVKVQYEIATRQGGKEKREMWVNFTQVTSAVKLETGGK